jgi:predicted component of type VI protein secretion system
MKAELVPENGDPPIPITRDVTVVGRREFCDVQVNDPSLSKRHCVLVKTDGLLVIRDLGTTNGTKVKGQRVRWAALLPDDRITLGSSKFRIYLGPDDAPAPSELARSKAAGKAQGQGMKGAGARPSDKAATALRPDTPPTSPALLEPEPARIASTTPALAGVAGEDDGNWQNLELLEDDGPDLMIELD